MIFIDSSVFIGAAIGSDDLHTESLRLNKELEKSKERLVTSSSNLIEYITALGYALGGKKAYQAYLDFLINPSLAVVYPDKELISKAMQLHLKYDGSVGLVDIISVQIMLNHGIKRIASFDSDFDKIDGIKRVTKL